MDGETTMKLRLIIVAAALALGACTSQVAQKEDMLAAAGFTYRPATTPQTAAALKALPPHRFIPQTRNGQTVWIYADPAVCGCLYAGDDAAYQRYKQEVFQKQLADEQAIAADANERAAMDQNVAIMRWEMWGPWAPYYLGP
jgi:hypothetical protein